MHDRSFIRGAALAAAILLALPAIARGIDVVRTGHGSLTLGGVVQAGFVYFVGDDLASFSRAEDGSLEDLQAADRQEDSEFTLNRLRLRLFGTIISERIRYFAQAEFGRRAELLDARLEFGYLPFAWIRAGRWVPALTFFGAAEPEDLLLIDYPLMDEDAYGNAVHRFRQTGLELLVEVPYLTAHFGLFNGQDNDGLDDNNSAKDFFLNFTARPPIRGLCLKTAFWYGLSFDPDESSQDPSGEFKERNDAAQVFVGGIRYRPGFGPIAVAEAAYRIINPAPTDLEERRSISWYVLAGFDFWRATGLPVQLLGRFDFTDPNVNEDRDDYLVVTAGLNYSFEGPRARLSFNYRYRQESFDVVSPSGSTRRGFEDDEFKFQVQVAF